MFTLDFKQYIPESVKSFLVGNGSYVTGIVAIVLGALSSAGLDLSQFGVTPENASAIIFIGISTVFLRRGVTNEVKKLETPKG